MAYTETGFKRSMKINITKSGDDGSSVVTTYDGQNAFGEFLAIPNDDDFRRLERNKTNGDWDLRLVGFKNYVLTEAGHDAYDSIDWSNSIQSLAVYDIKIMAVAGTQGTGIIAISYKDGINVPTNETVNIYFDTLDKTGVQLQIASYYLSGVYNMDQDDGLDIRDLSNPLVVPTSSVNGIYNITIDTENEW